MNHFCIYKMLYMLIFALDFGAYYLQSPTVVKKVKKFLSKTFWTLKLYDLSHKPKPAPVILPITPLVSSNYCSSMTQKAMCTYLICCVPKCHDSF